MRKTTIPILLDDYLPNVTSTIDIKLHHMEFIFTHSWVHAHSWGHERSSIFNPIFKFLNS